MSVFLPPPYLISKLLFFPVFSRATSLGLRAAKQIQLEWKKPKKVLLLWNTQVKTCLQEGCKYFCTSRLSSAYTPLCLGVSGSFLDLHLLRYVLQGNTEPAQSFLLAASIAKSNSMWRIVEQVPQAPGWKKMKIFSGAREDNQRGARKLWKKHKEAFLGAVTSVLFSWVSRVYLTPVICAHYEAKQSLRTVMLCE